MKPVRQETCDILFLCKRPLFFLNGEGRQSAKCRQIAKLSTPQMQDYL